MARVNGVEAETTYTLGRGSYVGVNYSFADTRSGLTGLRLTDTPAHRGNLLRNLKVAKEWNLFTHVQLKGLTLRAPTDIRAAQVPGYGVVNMAVSSGDNFLGRKGMQLTFGASNLLDRRFVDPSAPSPFGVANSDFPRQKRMFYAQLRFSVF